MNKIDKKKMNSDANVSKPTKQNNNNTCNPARADRDTALAFAFPESLPALPPA